MLFSKRSRERSLLEIFRTYSKELSSILDLKDLLKNLLRTLTEIAEVRSGSILLQETGIKAFVVRESVGGEPLILQFSAHDAFIQYLARTLKPMTKHILLQDRRLIDVKEAGLHFMTGVNAEAVFPMTAENKFLGLFALGSRRDGEAYSESTLDLLGVLITMASISVDNAILFESIAKQNLQLAEVAKLKTQFVSTVSHELSTPLNGILGLTEVLLDPESNANFTDDQRRYVEMIHSAGKELLEVVNHIIQFTQFQSKGGPAEIRKVDLGKTLEGLAAEVEDVLREKNIQMRIDLDGIATVYGDEGQIRQVFASLVENAIKFSRLDAPNLIGVRSSRHGDMLKVCVYDHGIGIGSQDQDLIFEDFRQADGELTRSYGGTGLGLAIAKKIVERHGGRIWVESKKGEGSQFFFTLPLKPASVDAREVDTRRE
ncbi:MAG: HAMP domain-containing histidine kinase [Deltaproteobacteria bacterium]|nr:HAMP domain-containing histidine kinase [Deltaproteobacteria bacterium]